MSSTPEYIQKLIMFLNQETSWNESIIEDITKFLSTTNPTINDIDSLMMAVPKKVETRLRETLAQHLGTPVPTTKSYGVALLDYAVDSHLIANRNEPIYSLIKLIIKVPRNTSHHAFGSYPFKTSLMFLSEANEAIEGINSLLKPSYVSHLRTNYDTANRKLSIHAEIFRPNLSSLPCSEKANAVLTFPRDRVVTVPLNVGSGSIWFGQYDVRGEHCGTVTCFIKGFDLTSSFVAASGSTLVVSYEVGQKCPACGNMITSPFTTICSSCGNRLPVV